MMIPIFPNVPPKPVVIEFKIPNFAPFSKVTVASGIPPTIPTKIVAKIKARNACTLVFKTKKMSRRIPTIKPKSIVMPSNP